MEWRCRWRNLGVLIVGVFFLYLFYLMYREGGHLSHEITIDLRELMKYCAVAAEVAASAIRKSHLSSSLWRQEKGKTREGASEYVTKADLISNQLIQNVLARFPGIQVISEEKEPISEKELAYFEQNYHDVWQAVKPIVSDLPSVRHSLTDISVWVDPLDATQEYTEELLEYVSVMICVVVRKQPIFGIISRPFVNETVWGLVGYGCYPDCGVTNDEPKRKKNVERLAVVSRSHAGEVRMLLLNSTFEHWKVVSAGGSGYKVLRVLNGTADMYIHLTDIKLWDLCAPYAIIRAAKGFMTNLDGLDISFPPTGASMINRRGVLVTKTNHFRYLSKIIPHADAFLSKT